MANPTPFALAEPSWATTPDHHILVGNRGAEYLTKVDALYEACATSCAGTPADRDEFARLAGAHGRCTGLFSRYLMRRAVEVAHGKGILFPHGDAAYKAVAYRIADEWAQEQKAAA